MLTSRIFLPSQYKVDVNGTRGELNMSLNTNNIVYGAMGLSSQPQTQIIGVYDDVSSKLTFVRIMNPHFPPKNQVFTGYLMNNGNEIAGYFEALPDLTTPGTFIHRTIFGWYGIK